MHVDKLSFFRSNLFRRDKFEDGQDDILLIFIDLRIRIDLQRFNFSPQIRRKSWPPSYTLANLHYLHSLLHHSKFSIIASVLRGFRFLSPSQPSSTDKSDNFLPRLPRTRIAFTSKCTVYDGARNYCIFLLVHASSLSFFLSRAFFFLLSFLKKCFIRDEIASRAFQEKYFTISHDNIYDGQRIVDTESVNQQLCCFEFLYFA